MKACIAGMNMRLPSMASMSPPKKTGKMGKIQMMSEDRTTNPNPSSMLILRP